MFSLSAVALSILHLQIASVHSLKISLSTKMFSDSEAMEEGGIEGTYKVKIYGPDYRMPDGKGSVTVPVSGNLHSIDKRNSEYAGLSDEDILEKLNKRHNKFLSLSFHFLSPHDPEPNYLRVVQVKEWLPIMPVGTEVDFEGARTAAMTGGPLGLRKGSKIVLDVAFVPGHVGYGFTIEGIFEEINRPNVKDLNSAEGVTLSITSDPVVKENAGDEAWPNVGTLGQFRLNGGMAKYWIPGFMIRSIKKIEEPPVKKIAEPVMVKKSEVKLMSTNTESKNGKPEPKRKTVSAASLIFWTLAVGAGIVVFWAWLFERLIYQRDLC